MNNISIKTYSGICNSCEIPCDALIKLDKQLICKRCIVNVKCHNCKKNITTTRNVAYYSIIDNEPLFCGSECSSKWACVKTDNTKDNKCSYCAYDDNCNLHSYKWVKKDLVKIVDVDKSS